MSCRSNNQGRAYEYITLQVLFREISKIRKAVIIENTSLYAAQNAWDLMGDGMQKLLKVSAEAFVPSIFDLEPLILEDDEDTVELLIQQDARGEDGDVRDILIVRSGIEWEIGLSMKHNHFAVKHSRLSPLIDFGNKWYGHKCSQTYWDGVLPIFNRMQDLRSKGVLWRDVSDKQKGVYIPVLKAFRDEIKRASQKYKDLPSKLTEYLLGEYDFYKVISIDRSSTTLINAFNLYGTLNQSAKKTEPKKKGSIEP